MRLSCSAPNRSPQRSVISTTCFASSAVKVRKGYKDCDAMCGLMILVLKDLANGYLAVGGQTAIGRGILKGHLQINDERKYLMALKELIQRGKSV